MTKVEARERATEYVFMCLTLGELISKCEAAGIKTFTKRGRRIDRTALELKLIEHYAEEWSNEEEKK